MIYSTLINLHHKEYVQRLHYYTFAADLDIYVESCNTINELYNKLSFPKKTKDVNLSVYDHGNKWVKNFIKHTSCEWICKFDSRKGNSNQKWNNDKCRRECKKHQISEQDYMWKPAICSCENGKYLAIIIDNLVIM